MKTCPAREDALQLLKKYNAEPFHIQHALTVEGTMPNDCKLIVKGGKTLRLFNPKGLTVLVK